MHGDLAARNILLNQSGIVKISDFGLSKVSDWYFLRVSDSPPQSVLKFIWNLARLYIRSVLTAALGLLAGPIAAALGLEIVLTANLPRITYKVLQGCKNIWRVGWGSILSSMMDSRSNKKVKRLNYSPQTFLNFVQPNVSKV